MPAAGRCVRAAPGADVRRYISGQAAESYDGEAFLEADTAFHLMLLEGSGNPVTAQFALVVTAALRTRDDPQQPLIINTTPVGIALHN